VIGVIEYGAGNVGSVLKALGHLGAEARICRTPAELAGAERIVLPGVGAFGEAVENLTRTGLGDAVREALDSGKPYLGICLGLQLLFEGSEESSDSPGLGVFPGRVRRFVAEPGLKVPHMGWSRLAPADGVRLFDGLDDERYVYFLHSYYLGTPERDLVSATAEHGVVFDAAVEHDNVFAVQFHPEKSGRVGLTMLRNFLEA